MSVFRRTNCNNCKPMWWCTEIVLRQLHFFAIYLCFAGINEPNCMFLFFVLIDFQSDYVSCDHILSACAAHKLNAQVIQANGKRNNCKRVGNVLCGDHTCFAVPNAKNVNHVVLYWGSFAIINSAAAICWELYLACFAVTNSTVNCLVMHLPWWTKPLWQLWQYSKCIHCP